MASLDVRDYLLSVENDKTEALRVAEGTAQRLELRQTTLLDVVQSLGEYINDEDLKIRGRAVSYLTAVLSALPSKFLSRQQLELLCQFFSDRIEDVGAIDGLMKLQSLDRFSDEMAQTVVRAIFEHFPDFQSRPQSGRHHILQLLNDLMSNHRKALRMMGDKSLVGIVDLVTGEKDPRNLMLVFSMCRVLMLDWDISNHAEMLFDSVYAYFPITFRPPPNDPYGITAQDLKDRLRSCISSTSDLAPYAIPNLLDKLDSTAAVVKKDVLSTLLACAQSYNANTMAPYSITLWDSLKFEVLSAQEPELANDTLVILRSIATCLSASHQTSTTASPLAHYIRPINQECIDHLHEPTQRQAKASGDILRSVSSASVGAFSLIVKAVIAPILTIYQSTSETAKHRAILEVLSQLFESAAEVFGTWTSSNAPSTTENPLEAFSEKLLHIFGQALMSNAKEEVSLRIQAALGLSRLAKVRGLLQENEIGTIIQYLNELVLHGESYGRDDLKRTAMQSLAEISKYKPRLIMDITFPAFMAQLPDTDAEAEARGDYQITLEGLAEISIEREVFDTFVRRLLNKLEVLLNTQNVSSPKYAGALLSTLLFIMERRGLENDSNVQNYFDRIVIGLISRATKAAAESRQLTALNNVAVLDMLGRLSNLIVRHTKVEKKALTCANIYDMFSLKAGFEQLSGASNGSPLQSMWILSTWLLAAIPRGLQAPQLETDQISAILPRLIALLHEDIPTVSFVAISRQVALYINKHLPPSASGTASNQMSALYSSLHQPGLPSNQAKSSGRMPRTIRTIFIVSKALVLRLSPHTNAILEDLLSLLDSSKYPTPVNKVAASSFWGLLASDAVLSKANGAQIRLLVPQKVFQTLIPMIEAGFRLSSDEVGKENYLTALSGVIAAVPTDIIVPGLPTLLPLLLQSLDLSDQRVKIATLETLAVVISRNPSALEESGHIPSLVSRLLKTCSMSKGSADTRTKADTPQARQLAVRCLLLMPSQIKGSSSRTNSLLPLKRAVLQGLMKVLDDPKRDVRKEAVDARGAWLRGVDDVEDDSD